MITKLRLKPSVRMLQLPVILVLFIAGVLLLAFSMPMQVSIASDEVDETVVSGVVENTIIVQTPDGNVVKLLALSDGKKYRLREGQGAGVGKGFKVELNVSLNFEQLWDEVIAIHPNAILVNSIKITAIPIPGTKQYLPIKARSSD